MKPYDPATDRHDAHRVLRELMTQDPVAYTPHPGDWDWWTFHGDPRDHTVQLIGSAALADVTSTDPAEMDAFGLTADEAIELGRTRLPGVRFTLSHVSMADHPRVDALLAGGFQVDGPPSWLFERLTAGSISRPVDGFEIRPILGESEHVARADAARLAFKSTLDPDAHRARYLRFMQSPAYVAAHDIVAVAPDGTIASFTIFWADAELSLAQFEPVGTHPDYQRRGLARAVLMDGLARLEAAGIERARVMTGGANEPAKQTYLATGFQVIDRIGAFRAPPSFEDGPGTHS